MATPAIFYSHWQLDILKAVLQQKSNVVARVAMPVVPNVCNMLQNVQLDEYSATLSQRFCRRTYPWLHVQHYDFTILQHQKEVSCCQREYKYPTCSHGFTDAYNSRGKGYFEDFFQGTAWAVFRFSTATMSIQMFTSIPLYGYFF